MRVGSLAFALLLAACGEGVPTGEASPQSAETPRAAPSAPVPVPAPTPSPSSPPEPEAQAPAKKARLDLRFAGDIIFGRYRADGFDAIVVPLTEAERAAGHGEIEGRPFAKMSDALAGDVVVANLETPVVETLPERSPSHADYRFGASREMVAMLPAAGFDVVSLANNHHNDLRAAGHEQSEAILRELGVRAMGAAQDEAPAIRVVTHEEQGWRIAFVAVTSKLNMGLDPAPPHIPFVETKALRAQLGGEDGPIARARADHDLVIVSLHWGEEYTDPPSPRQRKAARALIDAGADVVFGHHPHVLQGVEHYRGGLIAYSMGNFLFENASPVPKLTGVLGAVFEAPSSPTGRACLVDASFYPAVMQRKPFHHPAPATGLNYRKVVERITTLSGALRTRWSPVSEGGILRLESPAACEGSAAGDEEAP